MESTISFRGTNSGLHIGQNIGHITAEIHPAAEDFETSANRACLRDLQTTNPRHDKNRIEADKGGLLESAYNWILDNEGFKRWRYEPQGQLLWIKGDPGKGKTMLLCGIIDQLIKAVPDSTTISYFFCKSTDVRINHATAVLRGLIFMLVDQQPPLIYHIRRQYDHSGKQLFENINAWEALSEILTKLLKDPLLETTYVIIDALDECITDQSRLLEFIAQKSSAYPKIKWIVSSRNWPVIEEALDVATQKTNISLELNEACVSNAVAVLIHDKIRELAERKRYNDELRDVVSRHLLLNAQGTFLWVALVCKELNKVPKRHVRKKLDDFPSGLDELYRLMVVQINKSDDAELCRNLLGVVTTVYRPITLEELPSCFELPDEVADDDGALEEVVQLCGSLLTLQGRTISLVHQSAKDFLLREVSDEIFPYGRSHLHVTIFSNLLHNISSKLRPNIYGLPSPGSSISKQKRLNPDADPLIDIRYACVYWIDHLNQATPIPMADKTFQDSGPIGKFLRQDYLPWLEALSLLREVPKGVASLLTLQQFLMTRAESLLLLDRVRDACRFALYHKPAIEDRPLQAYASGLTFSPTGSITRMEFEKQDPTWISHKPIMPDGWGACLQTLEGHSGPVYSAAFSHDSRLLASGSYDGNIKIWDTTNGQCLQTRNASTGVVYSVAFSHDSKLLASASDENTIKIWDTTRSQYLHITTLRGHEKRVNSAIFSHDSKLLASASNDTTIKVWDVSSGECLQSIKAHSLRVTSVSFSHDSNLLASASDDGTIKIWDVTSYECLKVLKDQVHSVAFSPDSKLFATASFDHTVKLWETSSGQCLRTFDGHTYFVVSATFSHDSKLLVSSSYDRTIRIWEIDSGKNIQTFRDHTARVHSVSFSHNSQLIASSSDDTTVKIWDMNSSQIPRTPDAHAGPVRWVNFSHDSKYLASGAGDSAIKIWDTTSAQCLRTLRGHSGPLFSVSFSHDSKLLASASHDKTAKIWDPSNGHCNHTLTGHRGQVSSVAFSHNAKLIASASDDLTVRIWDTSNGNCLHTLRGHSNNAVLSVTFSHDSDLLASASYDRTITLWDPRTGKSLKILKGHETRPVNSTVFSRDSKLLASASDDGIVKLWDVSSGDCLQTLDVGRFTPLKSIDMANLTLETDNGTVCLPPVSGAGLTTTPLVPRFEGYSISSDGAWINWNSENLLWLPPEYRPYSSAVSQSTVCIACSSGRVLFLGFDTPKLQHLLAGTESL